MTSIEPPSKDQIKRWRRYLADEVAEGQLYLELASRKTGEERTILLGLAEAEKRHEEHWRHLLGSHAEPMPRPSFYRTLLRWLARVFGSVFVLALAQRAESDTPYVRETDATKRMAADEAIHEEVIRSLAARERERLSGNFRAAIFGANDGLVSNLALVLGIGATGVSHSIVLFSGIAGLLAGAMSMAAGEFVSVRSQDELLDAAKPTQVTLTAARHVDLNENELFLVYKARGMSDEDARHRALERIGVFNCDCNPSLSLDPEDEATTDEESRDNARGAAISSFFFFSAGAIIPVIPYMLGINGLPAVIIATVLVGFALLITGGIVGVLSGASPFSRALRQLAIGWGAAAVTYVLGLLFGTVLG